MFRKELIQSTERLGEDICGTIYGNDNGYLRRELIAVHGEICFALLSYQERRRSATLWKTKSTNMHAAQDKRVPPLIILVLAFVYAPCISAVYGFSDDFKVFFTGSEGIIRWTYANGRPLLAMIREMTLDEIDCVSSLGWMRAISIVGVIGLSLTFYHIIRQIAGPKESLAFCIALATLPSIQIFGAWALCMHMPYAAIAASWSAVFVVRATEVFPESRFKAATRWLIALVLILVTSSLYQPSVMWYWTAALIFIIDNRFLSEASHRRKVLWLVGSGLFFLFACFLVQKLFFAVSSIEPAARVTLASNPLFKLYWFARIQAPLALNLWHLMDSSNKLLSLGPACISLGIICSGYVLNCRRFLQVAQGHPDRRHRLRILTLRTSLIVLVVGLTHTHWLVIEESPQSYRVIAALAAAVWALLFWSLIEIIDAGFSGKSRFVIRRGSLAWIAIIALFTCQWSLQRYWIIPYGTAYRYVVYSLRANLTENITHVHVVRQGRGDGIVKEQLIDNFSIPMAHHPWMVEGMVIAALKDSGRKPKSMTITHSDPSEPAPLEEGTLVIDMRDMVLWRTR